LLYNITGSPDFQIILAYFEYILILIFIKRFSFFILLIASIINAYSQEANFRTAEKFLDENLAAKFGDLSVTPNWIENSNIFWYSFKTSAGKNSGTLMPEQEQNKLCSKTFTWPRNLTRLRIILTMSLICPSRT
jgi:hypothetical protein